MLHPFAHPVERRCAKFQTGQTFEPTTPVFGSFVAVFFTKSVRGLPTLSVFRQYIPKLDLNFMLIDVHYTIASLLCIS